MTEPKKKMSPLAVVASVASAAAGALAVRYGGLGMLVPLVALVAVWFVLMKLNVQEPLMPMLAILIAHTIWVLVGTILAATMQGGVGVTAYYVAGEVIIVALLVWWVLKSGSLLSIGGVIAFELVGLVSILTSDAVNMRGMQVYVVLHAIGRLAGIAAAVYAIVKRRAA